MYITVEQSLRNNGDRHLERAIAYASAQWPDHYYEGSIKKAIRNYKKADGFIITDPFFKSMIELAGNIIIKHVADSLMYKG